MLGSTSVVRTVPLTCSLLLLRMWGGRGRGRGRGRGEGREWGEDVGWVGRGGGGGVGGMGWGEDVGQARGRNRLCGEDVRVGVGGRAQGH